MSNKSCTLLLLVLCTAKGGFFQKVQWNFFRFPNIKNKIFQKAILSLKFKFPTNNSKVLLAGNLNFKLRIVFWNIFLGDWEIWETNLTFWKKNTFSRPTSFMDGWHAIGSFRETDRVLTCGLCTVQYKFNYPIIKAIFRLRR